jgi:hypothetical protein
MAANRLRSGDRVFDCIDPDATAEHIVDQFSSLNPYDRAVVPGSVLKIEDDNFDPETKRQRQLYCFAISSKRYSLFTLDANGKPTLTKWSEHGLGHLGNPTNLDSDDSKWIPSVLAEHHPPCFGTTNTATAVRTAPRHWASHDQQSSRYAAVGATQRRQAIRTAAEAVQLHVACHARALGHPSGVDSERFHLMAPYESDPERWTDLDWIDQYSGKPYRITTDCHYGGPGIARVKTYGDVFEEYEWHPESKNADANGDPAHKQTVGLLQRRHVHVAQVIYIRRESNQLEAVEAGVAHDASGVYTEYVDPRREAWFRAAQVVSLKEWERETGKPRRLLIDARLGRRRPHQQHREPFVAVARRLGRW